MDKVLPPFWVKLTRSKKKVVITKIILEDGKEPLFYPANSEIPYDAEIEVSELGHLPSERLRTSWT